MYPLLFNVTIVMYILFNISTRDDNGFVIHTDDNLAELNAEESSNQIYSTKKSLVKPLKRSRLIALGCNDKKVRFINSDNAKFEGPTIWGHAGSIRCVAINSPEGYVVSGSYDTSIRYVQFNSPERIIGRIRVVSLFMNDNEILCRQWSIRTRKCMRIFHGHRDTITCLQIYKDSLVSGSRDKTCKGS